MKVLYPLIILLFISNVKARTINEIIFSKMEKLPIDVPDLSFHYRGFDTLFGIEIRYFYKSNGKCKVHIFFISDTTFAKAEKQLSLQKYLIISSEKYHYIKYMNYSNFYGCEYNDIDSFSLCRNENIYLEAMKSSNNKEYYYRISNEDFFSVAKVKVIVYRFTSYDVKYAPFFYHFTNEKNPPDKLEKLIYKKTLDRLYVHSPKIFNSIPVKKSVECVSKYF